MGRNKIFEGRVLLILVPMFYLPSVPYQVVPIMRQNLTIFLLATLLDLEKESYCLNPKPVLIFK